MACEVTAVDGRDVSGLEHLQVPCPVPVEEMPAVPREALHGLERRFQSRHRFHRPGPAEIARGHCRKQVQAQVGRRGASGDERRRVLLEIVRRQIVLRRGHEGLEVAPGPSRRQAQVACIRVRNGEPPPDGRRAAGPQGERWRGQPQQAEGRGEWPSVRRESDYSGCHAKAQRGAARHLSVEAPVIEPRTGGRLRGGRPLEQMAARQHQPHQRSRDGVAHTPGVVGQEYNRKQCLRSRQI